MVAMISLWLKKVILVVLLAVLLDLLLPNGTMQRYVKMVMGFLIILTMLSPITALFSRSFSLDALEFPSSKHGTQNLNLEKILQEGNSLQQEQRTLAEEEWKNHICTSIKEQVEKQYAVTVTDVSLKVAQKQGDPEHVPEIQGVKLVIRTKKDSDSVSAVKPIDPVHVEVGENKRQENETSITPEMMEWNNQILSEISADLQIPKSSIEIHWEQA
ncbi:hypothetical protein DNHGIG_01080 [Collibacillus ludicampi]|uniref:Stage III sporulation protein AF n=1 Tax=Collibacillus ludicampi TaxID=2771369 RepID=A0AAV4L9Z6_9BACL|nr:stage III sporulation protein AF [Collibacillus ludicampi]GIM44559.1 hypothetical protein DNHGIG_01080 [Collibacillus ludicampi]